MTTKISSSNIQTATLTELKVPKISNVQVTNSSYTVLDDTAVDIAGGYIKLTGTGFESGCQLLINNTPATSVTFVSSTEVRAQVPATAAGSYVVYLINADGGVAIRINGITFSATPTWVTGSTLNSAASDTAISIQLSATGATTYALQAGSTLPAGLTLSNVGLLSGTITGISTETTYNFTVVATDAENQDSPRAFSITITTGDQYWNYTTTLLSPTLSALPFNRDASTNNFAVTINGDTKPNNFNPYTPGYYSATFNGTNSTAIGTFTGPTIGTSDYTIEFWIYHNTIASDQDYYETYSGSSLNILLEFDGTAKKVRHNLRNDAGTSNFDFNSTSTLTANIWYHIAFVVSGTTAYTFINGDCTTLGATASVTGTRSASYTATLIGSLYSDARYLNGYMSNFRFVKGTALYTSNFTPPTSPLTAVTNTALLLFQSNRFIDNSTNNYSIPKGSASTINSFNPYTPSSSYSSYGSTYFDGTGDYLTVPANSALTLGTSDYTVEAWINLTGTQTTTYGWGVIGTYPGSGTGWSLTVNRSTGGQGIVWILGSSIVASYTTAYIPTNTWTHIAITRSGTGTNNTKIFLNGALVTQATDNTNDTFSGLTYIGGQGTGQLLTGYISNARVVKGTALYTSNFTPPTTPLTAISGTSLLTCQSNQPANNNVFLDNSTNNFAITRNGNTTQGTFSPYGENWSNYFDGSGDYLTTPNIAFASNNFTIEGWFYPTTIANLTNFWGLDNGSGSTPKMLMYINSSGNLTIDMGTAGTTQFPVSASASTYLTANAWNHIAVVRSGTGSGQFVLYINGTSVSTGQLGTNISSITAALNIGYIGEAYGQMFSGYISNFRIVNGTALYTSTFTPSTTPLQAVSGTSLLTCQSPNLVDNSTNNFAITKNGDVSVQKFGPFPGTTLPAPVYSAYFDGTGDYLTTAGNTALDMGTGDFTIECFTISNGYGGSQYGRGLWALYPAGNYNSRILVRHSYLGQILGIYGSNGSTAYFGISGTGGTINLTVGQWYHVAFVRQSGVFRLYINGVQDIVVSNQTAITLAGSNCFDIGRCQDGTTPDWNGYISNFRAIKGTCLYPDGTTFTPPTSPLTSVSGTGVLTCKSNTFVDSSSNEIALTVSGTPAPRTVNPFSVTYSTKQSYTPSVYGGSMYFDGTGDYLTVNDGLHLGTSDFTIEFWNYNNVSYVSTAQEFVNGESSGSGVTWAISYSTYNGRAGFAFSYGQYGSYTVAKYVNGEWGKVKAWTHYAVQRRNGVIEIYVDGVKRTLTQNDQNGTFSDGATLTSNYTSRNIANGYNGYISDFRITKGSAVYSSNFVPQNTPLQAIKNTTLVLNGTSASVYDSSTNAVFETVGDTKLSTTTVKFAGTTSIYLDGTGDYLAAPPPPSCMSGELGTGDFTIEYWMNASAAGTYVTIVGTQSIAGNSTAGIWRVGNRFNGANGIYFNYTNGGSFIDLTFSTTNYNDGAWHHVAFVRSSGSLKAYVDGTQVGSAQSVTQSLSSNQRMYVGYNVQDNAYYTGYISDLRITKGIARYTANFTAPTTPLISR